MLRISKLTDYGTLILAHMAGLPDRVHSAAGLAEALGLGLPTVSKVLKTLGRHALVISQRGAHGGYLLSRPPAQISVADVIRAVDGPLVSVYGLRPESVQYKENADALQDVWVAARGALRGVFEEVSIQQIANADLPEAVTSLTDDEDAWQPH